MFLELPGSQSTGSLQIIGGDALKAIGKVKAKCNSVDVEYTVWLLAVAPYAVDEAVTHSKYI